MSDNAIPDDRNAVEPDSEDNDAWLCWCGHYQEDGLHCDKCGTEPPWGCPCSGCQDDASEDGDAFDDIFGYDLGGEGGDA